MKKQLLSVLAVVTVLVAMTAAAAAQGGTTKVQGVVKDDAGQPVVDAHVVLIHKETGRKFNLKTDKEGRYFSLGVHSGVYSVEISKDDKLLWKLENFQVRLTPEDMVVLNVDLALEKKQAVAEAQAKMTEEQKKEMERIQKENAKIGNLNKMLADGQTALDAGNFAQAVATFKAAAEADPTRDLLWARLGNAYNASAKAATDAAARKQGYADGAEAYRKALDLSTATPAGGVAKTPNPPVVGAYYNNLGEALSKSGDSAGALEAFRKAGEIDPSNAALYYFNEGATLTNTGKVDEALQAYDKAIAADPTRADSYYYRGINLLSKATTKGDQMVPAPGTAEAFNKYLELAPEGGLAEQAKQMLAAIGAKVETNYGTRKKGAKK